MNYLPHKALYFSWNSTEDIAANTARAWVAGEAILLDKSIKFSTLRGLGDHCQMVGKVAVGHYARA